MGVDLLIDEDWFARLYGDSYRRLVLAAYALTNDLGRAQEITQEAFAHAFGRRAVLVDADSPEAWIRSVEINLAHRRRRARFDRILRILRRHPSEPEPSATGEHVDLHAAVRALTEEHRRVVVLHHLADLPVDEIASVVDIPVETVEARLAHARNILAARLGTDDAELDARLAELREELRGSVPEPELHEVLIRSRQRATRRRRRVGVLIAVVVVAAAIPVLRTTLRPVPDTAPAATSTTPTTPQPDVEWGFPTGPFVFDIDLFDTTHGFALRSRCASNGPCTNELLVTEDGEHWAVRTLPPQQRETPGPLGRLLVLGPDEVVWDGWGAHPQTVRWYSDDSGRTWRQVSPAVEQTVPAIPAGALLENDCIDPNESFPDCRKSRLVVSLPGSGRRAALATQPPLQRMSVTPIAAADGNWWVSGWHPGTTRWGLAVSKDAGHSWTVAELPDHAGGPYQMLEISAGPDAAYATAYGEQSEDAYGPSAIFHSDDGGRTWTRTWQWNGDKEPRRLASNAIAAWDGTMRVVSQDGASYVSGDGGRTLIKDFTIGRQLGYIRWTRAGYLSYPDNPSGTFTLSVDGDGWRDLRVN